MKTLILILSLIVATNGFAQNSNLPTKEGKIFYEKVLEDSASKSELYTRAKNVFLKLFPSKDVIQNEDKEAGKIIGKGNFTYTYKAPLATISNRNRFTLDITVKENKYRIQLYDFYNVSPSINYPDAPLENTYDTYLQKPKPYLKSLFDNFNNKVLEIMNQIEREMKKKDSDF